jgi:hypothetical protein
LDRRLYGPQSRSGCGGEKKNSQPLPGLKPPIIQPVAQRYTAELSPLLYDAGTSCFFELNKIPSFNGSIAEKWFAERVRSALTAENSLDLEQLTTKLA